MRKPTRKVLILSIVAGVALCLIAIITTIACIEPNLTRMSASERCDYYSRLDWKKDEKRIEALPRRFQYEYWTKQAEAIAAEDARIDRYLALLDKELEEAKARFQQERAQHDVRLTTIRIAHGDGEESVRLSEEENARWESWRSSHSDEVLKWDSRRFQLQLSKGGGVKGCTVRSRLQLIKETQQEMDRARAMGYTLE